MEDQMANRKNKMKRQEKEKEETRTGMPPSSFISTLIIPDIILLLSSQAFLISLFFPFSSLWDHFSLKQSFSTSTICNFIFDYYLKYADLILASKEDVSTFIFKI